MSLFRIATLYSRTKSSKRPASNFLIWALIFPGTAFMGVLLFFALQNEGKNLKWWGTELDHCPLATCPTAPEIIVEGCPVFK